MKQYRRRGSRAKKKKQKQQHTHIHPYETNRGVVLQASSAHRGLNYGVAGQLAPRINDCSCYVKHPGTESCPESSPTRHPMEVEEERGWIKEEEVEVKVIYLEQSHEHGF